MIAGSGHVTSDMCSLRRRYKVILKTIHPAPTIVMAIVAIETSRGGGATSHHEPVGEWAVGDDQAATATGEGVAGHVTGHADISSGLGSSPGQCRHIAYARVSTDAVHR